MISIETAVEIVSPFPREHYKALWMWMCDFLYEMFDDFCDYKTYRNFEKDMDRRATEERTWMVMEMGVPVGFVSYQAISRHLGSMKGICFAKAVHGTGIPQRGMQLCLDEIFATGVFKVMSYAFADNFRSIAFYKKLGAREQGLLERHTLRNGIMTDMLQQAFFADSRPESL